MTKITEATLTETTKDGLMFKPPVQTTTLIPFEGEGDLGKSMWITSLNLLKVVVNERVTIDGKNDSSYHQGIGFLTVLKSKANALNSNADECMVHLDGMRRHLDRHEHSFKDAYGSDRRQFYTVKDLVTKCIALREWADGMNIIIPLPTKSSK
jgi:hypothetical protein